MSEKKNNEEFSQENGNMEVSSLPAKEILVERENGRAVELADGRLDVRKGGSVVIGTLNIVMDPFKKHFRKRHEKFYKTDKFHLVADIVLAAIILALATMLYVFFNFEPKAQIDLQTVLSDDKALSGQSETFTINYVNNGKTDINDATLSLTLPDNFVLLSVAPDSNWSDQTNTFKIGDLPRGANGKVKIIGVPLGEVGSQQDLIYSLNYAQNGRHGNMLGSYAFVMQGSTLEVSFDSPKNIYQNINFGGTIVLKNNGRVDINQEINLINDNSAIVLKNISADQATLQNGVIIVNGLKAGASIKIDYEAITTASEGGVKAILSSYLNLDGQKFKQGEAVTTFNVEVPKFGVDIVPDKEAISSSDLVNFKLKFVNKENSLISTTSIDIKSSDNSAAIKSLVLKNGSGKFIAAGDSIFLGNLQPSEEGELDFDIVFERKSARVNQQIGIIADVNYLANGKKVAYQMFSPKIKLNSNLQISSKGIYYGAQGDQLGVGPLPPVVDLPTRYWIFWDINNIGNDLKNFEVSADLPANVGWTGQKTALAGDIRYGEISHKVVWTVDGVAASGGNYRVGFEVELIPTVADLGRVPNLVSNIMYDAIDVFTGKQITGSLADINADIKDDKSASGKGRVIELNVIK